MSFFSRLFEIDSKYISDCEDLRYRGWKDLPQEGEAIFAQVKALDKDGDEYWSNQMLTNRAEFNFDAYEEWLKKVMAKAKEELMRASLMETFSGGDFDHILSGKTRDFLDRVDRKANDIDRMTKEEKKTFVAQLNAKIAALVKQGKFKGLRELT